MNDPFAGHSDDGGLKLSFRRRASRGVSLTGNYTLSNCVGNVTLGDHEIDSIAGLGTGRSTRRSRVCCGAVRLYASPIAFTIAAAIGDAARHVRR